MSRLEIIDAGRRRRFTAEAKLKTFEEGFSATAQEHGVSRSQLYPRRQLVQAGNLDSNRMEGFLPALIIPDVPTPGSIDSGIK